ncbi:hypothetical protein GCM10009133_31570 [Cocleimonas flava]
MKNLPAPFFEFFDTRKATTIKSKLNRISIVPLSVGTAVVAVGDNVTVPPGTAIPAKAAEEEKTIKVKIEMHFAVKFLIAVMVEILLSVTSFK